MQNFNPRAPCGARRFSFQQKTSPYQFQPTRPLRGATNRNIKERSITYISTHAPLAGRDDVCPSALITQREFQPTRPLRGATPLMPVISPVLMISTHAPLAGRDLKGHFYGFRTKLISTHAPLAGRDSIRVRERIISRNFNPRAPCGARLLDILYENFGSIISTHAPLAGRDSKSVQITMHIFATTDKFQMLLHRMPPVRAFCSFLMQENHADFGCEPPK